MNRTPAALLVALSLVGCSKKEQPAAGSGSGSGSAAGSAKSSRPPERPMHGAPGPDVSTGPITLPKGDGTPPLPLTAALPATTIKRLGEIQFPGFDNPPADQHGLATRIDLATHERPILKTLVFLKPCLDKCTPMTEEAWNAELPRLKNNIRDSLRDLPDLTWDHGWIDVHGAKVFYTYQAGQTLTKDAAGNSNGAWTDAFTLHWNNGFELVEIIAKYEDDPLVSKAEMLKIAPEADLQRLAIAFFDYYTHQWVPTAEEAKGP